tara:strand:- start:790 stop:1017 length:228 start_codon:yes stop_codon:yes gene_type:complete
MALPIILGVAAAGAFGAFVGSQIDDAVEGDNGAPINPLDEFAQRPSATKIAYYAAIGMGLFWLANRSGVTKALKL